MTNALLSASDRKEALSRAYVQAVAARASYTTAAYDFDRHGVDLRIQAGGSIMPALEVQLKATTGLPVPSNDVYRYALERKNYRNLISDSQTPRILVVLDLPTSQQDWLTISAEALTLKRCAYWLHLHGHPPSTNVATVTVSIPVDNQFDVAALEGLMEQSQRGEI